jgi:hypothetical protein
VNFASRSRDQELEAVRAILAEYAGLRAHNWSIRMRSAQPTEPTRRSVCELSTNIGTPPALHIGILF